jgi:hypothetical protein
LSEPNRKKCQYFIRTDAEIFAALIDFEQRGRENHFDFIKKARFSIVLVVNNSDFTIKQYGNERWMAVLSFLNPGPSMTKL